MISDLPGGDGSWASSRGFRDASFFSGEGSVRLLIAFVDTAIRDDSC